MTDAEMLVLLLISYIHNFPIIRSWGMHLRLPLALVAEKKQILEDFVSNICEYPVRIHCCDGVPGMQKKICEKNRFAIFMDWGKRSSRNEKELTKFDVLESLAASQKYGDGHKLDKPVFLLGEGMIEAELMDRIVMVNVPSEVYSDMRIYDYIPESKDLADVKCEIMKIQSSDEVEQAFIAAACFLAPKLDETGTGNLFESILEFAKELAENATDIETTESIVDYFNTYIINIAESGYFENVIELPNLGLEAFHKLDDGLFIDGAYLYMSERKFAELCKGIQEFVSFNSLKQALKAENVIRSNTGGYTVKMNYMTSAGVPGRKRMICIDTSQVCSRDGCTKLEFYINID